MYEGEETRGWGSWDLLMRSKVQREGQDKERNNNVKQIYNSGGKMCSKQIRFLGVGVIKPINPCYKSTKRNIRGIKKKRWK